MSNDIVRTEDGRFPPGVSGNPAGRPKGRKAIIDQLKQDLEIAVRSNLRADRVAKIVEKMCDQAENGDVKAARLILSMAVSPAAVGANDKEPTPGITIRIENATFAAKAAAKQEQPIEGRVIEEKNENG